MNNSSTISYIIRAATLGQDAEKLQLYHLEAQLQPCRHPDN